MVGSAGEGALSGANVGCWVRGLSGLRKGILLGEEEDEEEDLTDR